MGDKMLTNIARHPFKVLSQVILVLLLASCAGRTTSLPTADANNGSVQPTVQQEPSEEPAENQIQLEPVVAPVTPEIPSKESGEAISLADWKEKTLTGMQAFAFGINYNSDQFLASITDNDITMADSEGNQFTTAFERVKVSFVNEDGNNGLDSVMAVFDDNGLPTYVRVDGNWVVTTIQGNDIKVVKGKTAIGRFVEWRVDGSEWELDIPLTDKQLTNWRGEGGYMFNENGDLMIKIVDYDGNLTSKWGVAVWNVDGMLATNPIEYEGKGENGDGIFVFAKEDLNLVTGNWAQEKGILTVKADDIEPYGEFLFMPEWGRFCTGLDLGIMYGGHANYISWGDIDNINSRRALRSILRYTNYFPEGSNTAQFYITQVIGTPGAALTIYPDTYDQSWEFGKAVHSAGIYNVEIGGGKGDVMVATQLVNTDGGVVVLFQGYTDEWFGSEYLNPRYPDGKMFLEKAYFDVGFRIFKNSLLALYNMKPWDLLGGKVYALQPSMKDVLRGHHVGSGWLSVDGIVPSDFEKRIADYELAWTYAKASEGDIIE
jgi:uncharacterized protein YegL